MKNLSKDKHIIFICENDLTQPIGGTIHVKELLAALVKFHSNITLIAPDYHREKISVNSGINTIFIKTINMRILKWLLFYFTSTLTILRLILKHKKVVIYSREMANNVLLPVICKMLNIPLFIEVNGAFLAEMESLGKPKILITITKISQKIIYTFSVKIITVADELSNYINKTYRIPFLKLTTIYNGINYSKSKEISPVSFESVFDKKGLIIGFVGSCYPYHDIALLINIASDLIEYNQDLYFVVAGDGEELPKWKEQAKKQNVSEHFYFPGYIKQEIVKNYIASFDICIALYKKNVPGPGMKILEYSLYNKPVVASFSNDAFKLFGKLENIIWTRPEDTADIKQKLTFAIDNLSKFKTANSREFLINNYTWDHTARNILDTIEKTLALKQPF